jgi:DNA repair exonuclease SbcCD nuclease subunit
MALHRGDPMRFLHTADWQIGKPFARVPDAQKGTLLRQERIAVVKRIGNIAREKNASFVLVAGDLFDSTTPDRSTVSAACSAIGSLGVPVIAIPGNHDHAGPGTIWEQEFFLREQQTLAPNFRLLDKQEPYEVCGVVIMPCPLTRKQQADDPTAWLRDPSVVGSSTDGKLRIVLAHGSVQGFSSVSDDEESSGRSHLIDLDRLDPTAFDYLALGDWHGAKSVGGGGWTGKAWYSGTPELDRFAKGGDHDPGNVLLVEIPSKGQMPTIQRIRTARLGWHDEAFTLVVDASLTHLEARLDEVLGPRTGTDLLKLTVEGQLGFEGDTRLRGIVERLEARLLRLKLDNRTKVLPSESEIARLSGRAGDPLISAIAARLKDDQLQPGPSAALAGQAIRELYAAVEQCGGLT